MDNILKTQKAVPIRPARSAAGESRILDFKATAKPQIKSGHKAKKVVVVGGGTGVFSVLAGLRKYNLDLSAVVSVADDGGSSGVLREEFGILPPGDIRRALVAFSNSDRILADLFNYRFEEGGLKGHTFGNIMLTALERITGDFESAVNEAGRILGASGRVIPVTLSNVSLAAKLEDGSVIKGETNIDIPKHDGRLKIVEAFLEPKAEANQSAVTAIKEADLIVIGPGDLYTSIVPNLLVSGITRAVKSSLAQKIYVVNIMTKLGETGGFAASDFIKIVEKYLGRGVLDYAIINTKRPTPDRLRYYEKEAAEFVEAGNLAGRPTPLFGDFIRRRGFVRHDPERLAEVLVSLL